MLRVNELVVALACVFTAQACGDAAPPALPDRDAVEVAWPDAQIGGDGADSASVPTADIAPFGLPPRLINTRCRLDGEAAGGDPYEVVRQLGGLAFQEPADVIFAPGDATRVFIQERAGRISVVNNDAAAATNEVFLDMSDRVICCAEQGLLGFAFAPDYADSGYFYVYYSIGSPLRTRLSRFRVMPGDPNRADPASELVVLEIAQASQNHHGGTLRFAPDGYLYVGVGDGSGNFDLNEGLGQRLDDLSANILRLDVSNASAARPYAIPPDNPFVARAGARPEIYAYGFRNPWRFSFDVDGTLWIGDVQEASYEEINIGRAGGNYGWNRMEASHCMIPPSDCDDGTLIKPTFEYPHANGQCAIIGGYVYRGASLPDLVGAYLYADHCTGRVWALRVENGEVIENTQIASTGLNVTTLTPDAVGEPWLTSLTGGVYRLEARAVSSEPSTFPETLSETGCFADLATREPADGVIPYDLASPLWSDDAHKLRWLVLPGVKTIGFTVDDFWDLPVGTLLIKEFRLETVLGDPSSARAIETRFLSRQGDGWRGYSYRWNEAGTDAELLPDGLNVDFTLANPAAPSQPVTRSWYYPSRSDCLGCHNAAAGGSLGLRTSELNIELDYAGVSDNQLRAMEHIGLFGGDLPARPHELPQQAAVDDESLPLEARVKSYLQANCAHCHRPGGPTAATMDLRLETPLAAMGIIDVVPQRGDLGLSDPAIVKPGDPEASVLYRRMSMRGPNQMPPFATAIVDELGTDVVRRWIEAMEASP